MSDLFTADAAKPKGKRAPKPAPIVEIETPDNSSVEQSVGALVEQTQANPVAVFTDKVKFSEFAAKLKAETDKHVADVTTEKGRKAIISLAFRVTKAKTTLVAAGKGLTEDWRNKIALVNASRNEMEAELDNLARTVRAPVTEWEATEKLRTDANLITIGLIQNAAIIGEDDTAASVETRGRSVYEMKFEPPQWLIDEIEQAESVQKTTIQVLFAARNRLAKEEADAAELAELRRKQAERDEADRLAAEKAEAERLEALRVEEIRITAERAETERLAAIAAEAVKLANAQREAAEQAKREAEAAAQAERDKVQAEFEAALQAEKARAAEAEAKAIADRLAADAEAKAKRDAEDAKRAAEDAERQRIHDAELEAARKRAAEIESAAKKAADEAEAQRVADAKRAKDRAHVAEVMGAAKTAIMSCGVEENIARMIVLAIKAGTVPAVSITF